MSAPYNNRGQAGSQPPHVVQTILESFTRCFAPIDECSSPSNHSSMDYGGNNCYSSGITGSASATGGGGCDGRAAVSYSSSNDSKKSKSRNNNNNNMKVPRPRSSTTTTTLNNEGRRKGSATRPIPTAEELNERTMKRKLEIFRGSCDGSSSRVVPMTNTTTTGSSCNNLVQQHDNNRGQNPQSHQTTTTSDDDDDDDEEILRLTQNSARNRLFGPFGGCGLGHLPSHDNNDDVVFSSPHNNNHHHRHRGNSSSSPLFTNLGRRMGFGTDGQWSPPGFLCFATPIRSNSDGGEEGGDNSDNFAHLSDDKLTADEFLSRHGGVGGGKSNGNGMNNGNNSSTSAPPPKQVSPEQQQQQQHYTTSSSPNDGRNSAMSNQGGSVYTEITDAQTIESTLYFDQKYSHVIQTRPPMPLFQENIVTSCVGESYCGTTNNTTGGTGGGGGGGGSSFLFGEGLFSNSNVGNEISTIIKKRTSSQQH